MFLDQIHLQKGSKMLTERLTHGTALAHINISCILGVPIEYISNAATTFF
jgi:hypothetical protein